MEKTHIIYAAFNKTSRHVYIGMTLHTLEQRRKNHVRDAIVKESHQPFHFAIRKYGPESFDWVELTRVQGIVAGEIERFYISQFKEKGYKLYNATAGGEGGDTSTSNPRRLEMITKRTNTLRSVWKSKAFSDAVSKATKGTTGRPTLNMHYPKTQKWKENLSKSIKKKWETDSDYRTRSIASQQRRRSLEKMIN